MKHLLKDEFVHAGESVTAVDVKEVKLWRVKCPGGKYQIIASDTKPTAPVADKDYLEKAKECAR